MTHKQSVTLQNNGAYWMASYRDEVGALHRMSLGPKAKLTRKDALRRCHEIAGGIVVSHGALTMEEWTTRYFELRTDLGDSTLRRHRIAMKRMLGFFGAGAKTNRIGPTLANSFIAHLRTLKKANKEPLSKFTVWGNAELAYEIFGWARKDKRCEINPFEEARVPKPKVRLEWPYIPVAKVEELIEASPNASWRCMWALARYAGLRAGEALRLTWAHVDREKKLLYIWPIKGEATTKQDARAVPIVPRLEELLAAAYEAAVEGTERVTHDVDAENYRRDARATMKRVGCSWPKPFHTLRKALATDWKNLAPGPAVAEWLGHDEDVADTHYYATLPEITAMVTGIKPEQKQEAAK